jgi:hypothetical protein
MTGITGPFENSRQAHDASLWGTHGEQSGSMRAANLADLAAECGKAGVQLGTYDRVIVEWLAGYEPSAVAVICGLIARARAAALAPAEKAWVHPHLATLATLAAHIEQRLADEHASRQAIAEAAVTSLRTLAAGAGPGVTLSAAQLATVLAALADADQYRHQRAAAVCAACDSSPQEVCPLHLADLDAADVYNGLRVQLGQQEAGS